MAEMKMFRFEGDLYRMEMDGIRIVGEPEIEAGDGKWVKVPFDDGFAAMMYGMPVREDKGEWW